MYWVLRRPITQNQMHLWRQFHVFAVRLCFLVCLLADINNSNNFIKSTSIIHTVNRRDCGGECPLLTHENGFVDSMTISRAPFGTHFSLRKKKPSQQPNHRHGIHVNCILFTFILKRLRFTCVCSEKWHTLRSKRIHRNTHRHTRTETYACDTSSPVARKDKPSCRCAFAVSVNQGDCHYYGSIGLDLLK